MANGDWESKMNELREVQAATQHLLLKLAERHDNDISQLRDSQLVTQRQLELLERNVANLGTNVTNLETNVANLERNVANLGTDVANLGKTVNETGDQIRLLATVVMKHENEIQEHRKHENEIQENRVSIAELRAMMSTLIANIDRFIQGRQSNGH